MISINWPEIIRWLLLILGGGGTAALAVGWASSGTVKQKPVTPKDPESTPVRSADAGPPEGAVDWVIDIHDAMSGAEAQSVLNSLSDGHSRDQARQRRIAELENPSPAWADAAAKLKAEGPAA